ncbi:ATP-binding cassette domain-containing protein [Kribbella kalugense]|uniref:ATP-binding cassette subfamily B protein n=1 Tax=Kribbella kalugense TaxID=2512221 RepID=A0A4R7ZUF7_9ACTN|nr:ABC transporter ATP-binding protein [Kribbella kalugense]TDW21687.1 ATP-binding cassette subfamily B protein [Kribbella kalugense]
MNQLRVLWRASPVWSAVALALTVTEAAVRTLLMVGIGQFVGSLPASASARTWRWFLVVAVLLLAGPILQSSLAAVTARCTTAYLVHVFDLVAEVGVHPRGIGHLDTPDSASRIRAVVDATRDWSFVTGAGAIWLIIGPRLAGLGAIAVLLPWRWWVPLAVAASFLLVSRVFMSWISLAFDKLLETTGDARRRASYLRSLLTRTESAKEVRLFGLTDWLSDVYRSTWYEAMTELWRERRSGLGPVLLACSVMALTVGGAFALIGLDVTAGTVSLAGAVTMAQAILRLQNFGVLGDAGTALARSTSTLRALANVRQELGLPAIGPAAAQAESSRSTHAAAEVRLDGVSFGYPSRATQALSNLTLQIPAGQSIAIVGVNGAGKSTLIKLLCGLYEPDQGTVRVDGADPAVDEAARRRVAVIFQDFVRYHLPLRDNVVLGTATDDVLQQSLTDAGGLALLERHGWDTVLSTEYDGGTDLSGGQWQRVALARALAAVAGGAGVLVLDEPTAALDVRAEAALFERFLEVTRGVTTILVSHRLSSVRHADRIVVLASGGEGIVEDGSHDELMRLDGRYAEMFGLQARRFAQ